MEIVWLGVAFLVAVTLWIGAARVASRSVLPLLGGIVLTLVSAGLCFLISETKTGGFLAGLVGVLLFFLMLIAAGGLVMGAALRWLYERLRNTARPVPAPPILAWDLWLLGGINALAVLLSALE